MSEPLLKTKLFVPLVRPDLVPRGRLVEQLDAGLAGRLILVSAPAGFGKTTLLAEWAAHLRGSGPDAGLKRAPGPADGAPRFSTIPESKPRVQVAWLSLEDGDNDLARFLSYVVAAPAAVEPALDQNASGAGQVPASHAESSLSRLLNQVASWDDHLVLILDDYHAIHLQEIHDAVAFLLDHLPPQMHLAIATRADPPLPLPRLRARGELTELRQADLRFTPDEAAHFLARVAGLSLPAETIAALERRTEGWIAGLQMAALSMSRLHQAQDAQSLSQFVGRLTGSDRFILDYLVEEVLDRQPAAIQEFLLRTSVLDRLTGPLCDAVAAGPVARELADAIEPPPALAGSQATLEYLESANLFIVPLDNERRWYRYHRLFADLLGKRLRQTDPALVPVLHRRASEWCAENGLVAEAIHHSLAIEDWERAARLIEGAAEATLMRSEITTLLRWIDRLPGEQLQSYETLRVYHIWALLWGGYPWQVIEARLQDLSRSQAPESLASARAASLRAVVALFQGQIPLAAKLSRRALDRLPPGDSFLRSVALWNLAVSCIGEGDVETGIRTLEEIARASEQAGNVMIAAMVTCHLAELRMKQGQLANARDIYQRALDLATDDEGQRLPVASQALFGLGELSRQWDELATATRYFQEGLELIERWGEVGAIEGYVLLARTLQARGGFEDAHKALARARDLAIRFDATELDDRVVALQRARLWLAEGNPAAARTVLAEGGLSVDQTPVDLDRADPMAQRMLKYEYLVLARFWLAEGRPDRALVFAEPVVARMERVGRPDLAIEGRILQALALEAGGDRRQALAALERALAMAGPEGWVRIFVDEGRPLLRLVQEVAAQSSQPAYAQKLLAAWDRDRKDRGIRAEDAEASPASRLVPLVEPLSPRELEVLQLLSTGMSNPEIAARLFIAVSTVRSHCKNIYGKLDVGRRWDAVQRGRELGLI